MIRNNIIRELKGIPSFGRSFKKKKKNNHNNLLPLSLSLNAIRREKETLRKFNKQGKEIRVAHAIANANAKKRENLERFVSGIPKANHKFTVRRSFSMAEFVSLEAKVLR